MSDSLQPVDCSLPGSSVHGILQARILEWVARPSLLQGIFPTQGQNPLSSVSCVGRQVFTTSATWMLDHYRVYELQIFSPIPWVVFLIVSFDAQTFLTLLKSIHLFFYLVMNVLLNVAKICYLCFLLRIL